MTAPPLPDVAFTSCGTFGGGWLMPHSDAGWDFAERRLEVARHDAPPHPRGFVVEPWAFRDLVEWAQAEGLTVTLDNEDLST